MVGPFTYLDQDLPGPEVLAVIGVVPKRWGRMDRFSRLAVVEVGRALRDAELLRDGEDGPKVVACGGLIGAGSHGSLVTDLAYAATLAGGPELASPTLFSYTLPNIALAEAASHYGLTGPVYAIFAETPEAAVAEARGWLADRRGPEFLVAGIIDLAPAPAVPEVDGNGDDAAGERISVNLMIARKTCRT